MRHTLKLIYAYLFPALLTSLLLAGIWVLGQRLEPKAQDLLMNWSAYPSTQSPVVLVLIDDESIRQMSGKFGSLPWARQTYLEIFRKIQQHNPTLIVFDGHFMNLGGAEDRQVFEQMQEIPNLVTGLALSDTPLDFLNSSVPDYYRLNLGVVSIWQDPDGIIRSVKPFHQSRTGPSRVGVFPALSVAAAYDYLSSHSPNKGWILNLEEPPFKGSADSWLKIHPEKNTSEGLAIPLNPDGTFQLRWYATMSAAGYQHSHPVIPVTRFFDPDFQADLNGKIILVGSSSSVYRDYHPSPMALRHLGSDIHATAIDNILFEETIRPLPEWLSWVTIAGLFTLIFMLRVRLQSFSDTLLYTTGSMVIYLWFAFFLFKTYGWTLTVVTAELFMMVALIAASTFRIITGERRLALTEQSLSQLVSPDVYREIQKRRRNNASLLEAGGQRLEITSMFVDIRNFTGLAENLPPNAVTDLLNDFYTAVVNVVFNHHGTVDKFMGDGILIIFGAPIPHERHADAALAAALEILSVTEKLSARWQEEKSLSIEMGVSLNSGPAFVGFLGPQNKLEYTAVGDTVNICIRLQQQTKEFNTRLVVSEHTVQALQAPPECLDELGQILPKGREGVLKIYGTRPADNTRHSA